MATFDFAEEPFELRREAEARQRRQVDWWLALGLPAATLVLVGLWFGAGALVGRAAIALMDWIAATSAEQRFVGLVVVIVSCCVVAARTDPAPDPDGPEYDVR